MKIKKLFLKKKKKEGEHRKKRDGQRRGSESHRDDVQIKGVSSN